MSASRRLPPEGPGRCRPGAAALARSSSDFARRALGLVLFACCCTGCTSLLDEKVDIKNIFGPAGRRAKNAADEAKRDSQLVPLEGEKDFEAAKRLYEEKKYADALKGFKKIKKKYKDKPIEEDALFMIAECYFQLKQLPAAQDGYDALFKKYPSTRYLERGTRRMYAIARYWLNSPKPASEVELTAFTEPAAESRLNEIPDAKVPYVFPLTPNLFDRSRPAFDTQGRALQALRSVWVNDPSGPLAAEALMLSATYHLRKHDFREAERDFGTIREMYADGKHAQAAYVLGSYASLKSYQGAEYDGKQLDEARKLTESAVRLYPDLPQGSTLKANLEQMKEQDAERLWAQAEYRMRRREKTAAGVMCEYLVRQYPESLYATKAREMLEKLGPEYAAGIIPPVVKPKPETEEIAVPEPQEPGRVSISDQEARPVPEEE